MQIDVLVKWHLHLLVDIIEIPDGDNETNPNAAASDAGEKEMIPDQNRPSSPTKKRSRTDDHVVSTSSKRGERSAAERNPTDNDSTDSDHDSCSSSSILIHREKSMNGKN